MALYICKTLTPQGQIVKTKVEERTKLDCIKKLKKNGLNPISIKKITVIGSANKKGAKRTKNIKSDLDYNEILTRSIKRKNTRNSSNSVTKAEINMATFGKRITSRDIRVFSQNFYLLKKANFNNIHALSTIISTTENPRLRLILEDILVGVESGEYMYTTMEYYSDVFPYIYINMIKVGELSGSLEQSLKQGVEYLDSSDTLRKRIRKILIPNLLMFFGLIIGTVIAVIVGVPMLKGIFDSVGSKQQLPAVTMWLYNLTMALRTVWYIPVGIIVLIGLAFWGWISTPKGRYRFDYFKYTMPIFGKLIYLLDFSRLMQGVLLNLQNGMRIQDALEVSKNVVKNTVMMSIVEISINNIFVGQSWIEPFERAGFGDAMCIEMLKIGMQTDLTEMIDKMLDYVESDINNTLEKIVKVLPEISYMFVGIVLIFFVCAVLVPCISLYMGDWLFSAYDV